MGTRSTAAKKALTEPTTAIHEPKEIKSEPVISEDVGIFTVDRKQPLSIVNGNKILYFGNDVVSVTIEKMK